MGEVRLVTASLRPERYCASVSDIDPCSLADAGVRAVLLDLDNTLLARGESEVPSDVEAWVRSLAGHGLAACIVSNTSKPRVRHVAEQLDVPVVAGARKPSSKGYHRACALLGVAPSEAVMVGDQSYTDVLGAHRAGMGAILVMPLGTRDLLHTRLLRALDALAVRGMRPERRAGARQT